MKPKPTAKQIVLRACASWRHPVATVDELTVREGPTAIVQLVLRVNKHVEPVVLAAGSTREQVYKKLNEVGDALAETCEQARRFAKGMGR